MSTPLSSSDSYCTVTEFLERADARTVGDLVSDSGARVSASSLTANANVLTAIADASGMLESACVAGERYTPADLLALTGVSASFLRMLVSDLALGRLILRRPQKDTPLPASYQLALDWLEKLRRGERVFGFQETADAGVYENNFIRETDLQEANLATYQSQRLFGYRGNRGRTS